MADKRAERIANLIKPLRVKPGSKVNLAKDFDPGYKAGVVKKKDGTGLLQTGITMLADYQARLAAQDTYGVLVCLQALDAGGKDGTIRHVMSGVNPQGVHVSNFKVPSATVSADKRKQLQAVKRELEKEAPEGAPADPFAAREKAKAEAREKAREKAKAEAREKAKAKAGASRVAGNGHQLGQAGQPATTGRN